MIDTMMVHRFSSDGIIDLFLEMGQKQDKTRTWDLLKAEHELA